MAYPEFKERRQFPRFSAACEVMLTLHHEPGRHYQGSCQNLCAGGLYLTAPCFAPIGTTVTVTFPIKTECGESLIIEGTVIRSKFDKHRADLFHISIKFTHPVEPWITSCPELSQ